MNKKIKKLWVEALRSGEYKQARGTLRNIKHDYKYDFKTDEEHETVQTTGFCCLGVLCNLHAQAHPKIAADQPDPNLYLGEDALLPYQVRDWAGLPEEFDQSGLINLTYSVRATGLNRQTFTKGEQELAVMNDSGVNFKQIAQIIEDHL